MASFATKRQLSTVWIACRGIEEERTGTATREVEHSVKAPCQRVGGLIADATKVPVVLNEAQDGTLVRDRVIDEITLRKVRDDQQWQARTIATAILIRASLRCPALSSACERVICCIVGLIHNGAEHVIVPAVRVVIGDNYGGILPVWRLLQCIERIDQEVLLVQGI